MVKGLKRFFASLRFAQNDNYSDIMGERGVNGSATSTPLTFQNAITCCHSERSEACQPLAGIFSFSPDMRDIKLKREGIKMKTKKTLLTIILAIACLLLPESLLVAQQTANELYEKAVYTEEAKGDLQEAIKLFGQVVEKREADQAIRAKALLHVGLCYEKLGKEEATKAYQRLVNDFPAQKNEVAIARERLNRLIASSEKEMKAPLEPKFTKIEIPTNLSGDAKLSPDGKELALVSDKKLWKVPLSGNLGQGFAGTPVQVNTNGTEVENSGLNWSNNGKWIAFNEYPETMDSLTKQWICIVSSNGGNPTKIIKNFRAERLENYSISLSPDAKIIAYSSIEKEEQHAFQTLINGGSPIQMADIQSREPAFSPNGKWIAYVEDKKLGYGGGNLWIVPSNGGTSSLIAKADYATSPLWSPDNSMIAFVDYANENKIEIVEVPDKGKGTGNLISINIPEGYQVVTPLAGWTGDNKIGVVMKSKKERSLYSLPVEGGIATVVLKDCWAMQPRWSPDGSKIYYTTPKVEGSQPQQVMHLTLASVPAAGGTGKLLTLDLKKESVNQLGNGGGNRISPDGKTIISAAWEEYFNDINFPSLHLWKFSTDGLKAKKITNKKGHYRELFPCWSPDGMQVAFIRTIMKSRTGLTDTTYILTINSTGEEEKILATISDKFIGSLVWSPDGKMLAFFSVSKTSKAKQINFIDAKSGESVIAWDVSNVDSELAWGPDSKRIAFIDKEAKAIKIMNVDDGTIENIKTNLGDVKIFHLDWSPDGEKFVFAGEKKGLNEFWLMEDFLPLEKLAQNKEKENILITKVMEGTGSEFYGAPSPDGKYFAFVDYKTFPNDIVIKDIETAKEVRLLNQTHLNDTGDEGIPYNPVWSPDSKQIVYVWENDKDNFYKLLAIDINNPKPELLLKVNYDKGWIKSEDWSPDGKKILIQLTENNQTQLGYLSIENKLFHPLKKIGNTAPFSAKFSPSGNFVAFDNPPNEENSEHDIFVVDIGDKKVTKITSHPSHDYFLDWSPSGRDILFASDRTGTTDMWSILFNEGTIREKPKLITENIGNIKSLGSTQNGSFYYSTPGSWWDIYTTTIDPASGKVVSPATEVPLPYQGYNRHPVWSHDGNYLAYVSVRRHLRKPNILCIYTRETGAVKEFAFEKDVNRPIWFPDSKSVLLFGTDVLNITTGKIESVVQLKKDEELEKFAISISSDGKYIYYETRNKSWDKHSIIQRNLESSEEKEKYMTSDDNLTMALSPDNKRLAVLQRHNENTRILKILSVADSSEKIIHTFKQYDFGYVDLTWSSDGKYIYFSKIADSGWVLCRIPAGGGVVENLDVQKTLFTSITIHPIGQYITFSSFVGKEKPGGIWKMENFLPEEVKAH